MTQRLHPNTAFTCGEYGKLCYRSRAAKRHGANRRAYRCGAYWHLASYQPAGRVAFYRERGQ